ncbi:hypothetical protein [Natronorubrum aibiense]|uniref:Uncharacterized protein n=1 Tax=Natronorubrum aibiense TaxID=348826 RepID=A0A5P9P210_9EURY|nr:hypothetical protein [Natronorubrum aibiense]QFU82158.1 hypothetical protein GCU68_06245 [Natronorubrum aibiense]
MNRRSAIVATASLVSLAGCIFTDGEVEYERGEIDVVVDDTPVDLAADRFQSENDDDDSLSFHLHEQDDYWYMEGPEPVTFAEGLDLLPNFAYERRDDHHVVSIDDTTYDGSDSGTELTFLVDDESVDPTEYVVQNGDHLRLEITTGE